MLAGAIGEGRLMEWMFLPLRRYADFSGRSRRREYWSFTALTVIVMVLCAGLMFAGGLSDWIGQDPGNWQAPDSLLFWIGLVVLCFWWLGTIIPGLAVTVRRFHDIGLSGWTYVGIIVISMIPYVGWLANLGYLIAMLMPGTPGLNKYGDNPKNPGQHYAYAFS